MKQITIIIEKTSDFYDAYSENCDGIYGAGDTLEAVKVDVIDAIEKLKRNLPEDRIPDTLKGDYEIKWKLDIVSFLEYYSRFISLAGMSRITGVNQKQLSNYLNNRCVPRAQQTERIINGIHKFANELLAVCV